jgi:hypothetical protein
MSQIPPPYFRLVFVEFRHTPLKARSRFLPHVYPVKSAFIGNRANVREGFCSGLIKSQPVLPTVIALSERYGGPTDFSFSSHPRFSSWCCWSREFVQPFKRSHVIAHVTLF